eukprot:TRINITY_DN16537_c0_g2_i1.p1 TRINITY_DN16537_c0_g2~~TRINITY_DN16537_c0_g2_i1.p1  ORF type:complete len:221 (-),score=56.31 TRINITY_DN16537_c0_g2_i1:324-956(-)
MLDNELREQPAVSTCELGQLCIHLFVLLVMDAHVREAQLSASPFWDHVAAMPWDSVVRSGWPLFSLLLRLAGELNGWDDVIDVDPQSPQLALKPQQLNSTDSFEMSLRALLPRGGFSSKQQQKQQQQQQQEQKIERWSPNSLDFLLAVLAANPERERVVALQQSFVEYWSGSSLEAVLRSSHMSEAFAILERMSRPHYRANWADAWRLTL